MTSCDRNRGERLPQPPARQTYSGYSLHGTRARGMSTGKIIAWGRTNAEERQKVANSLATITETAYLTTVIPRREWRIDFVVTHRVLPISEVGHAS